MSIKRKILAGIGIGTMIVVAGVLISNGVTAAELSRKQKEKIWNVAHETPDVLVEYVSAVVQSNATINGKPAIQFTREFFRRYFQLEDHGDRLKSKIDRILNTSSGATTPADINAALKDFMEHPEPEESGDGESS